MSTRRRALFSFVLGLGIVLFGLLQRQGHVLELSLPFFVFSVSLVVSDMSHRPPRLRAARLLSASRVNEDEPADVTLSVTNEGPDDVFISIRDEIPHGTSVVAGEPALAARLGPEETASQTYTLVAQRGGHTQRKLRGALWAPWGLAVQDVTLRLETRLASLPVYESLGEIEIRPKRTHAFAGAIKTGRSGSGLEILGCREYSLGDDIRRINWRASARRDELIINTFEQERMTDVNIVVDARAHMHLQIGSVKTFDLVVRAAASVASHFLRQSNRVGLMVYGDMLNWTFPAAGRLQMERLLHALALARPSTRAAFGRLRHIPTRLFATGSQLVILSTLGSSEDAEVPAQLAARGYSVLLVYPNTIPLERSALPEGELNRLAERVVRLSQHTTLTRLARAGVRVIDWDVTEPFNVALHHASRSRRGVRR
ncbi:DUF58 domain-containing protein [Candidatus Bipolaricaulota bacterium]